ncbi:hypothetical protein TUBRATIS_11470 [Tubulinosema ratisbonensis]|uniref:MULE transposase domain-containing protein n=1 Tax=Tubulinosema ratisbonensis TaxID=291195 RepID=A0A437AMC5_9MICR|nr:hypothetical protein TUBRATIS_11470 [Tubulinosema ratisbonensis]
MQFYQHGQDNYNEYFIDENILIFYSLNMAKKLRVYRTWAVDGTFKVVPNPYYQLYTISFIENFHVFPVIFAVLKNKKRETYENLFTLINLMIKELCPKVIKTDFELASIQALQKIYPESIISGCQFHLEQALLRKVTDFGLKHNYQTSQVLKKFDKALLCLPYVKYNQILITFNDIRSCQDFPVELTPLYDYFVGNYIGDSGCARFPSNIWLCSFFLNNDIPGTNNAIEGWHNVLTLL